MAAMFWDHGWERPGSFQAGIILGEKSKALVTRDRKEQKQEELASGIFGNYFIQDWLTAE